MNEHTSRPMDVDALVERLRGETDRNQMNCPKTDSVSFVRCGRGDCACEWEDRQEAAAALLALRAERDALREQLQYAADSFRSLGCAVDADECEAALAPASQTPQYEHEEACPSARDMPRGMWVCTCAKPASQTPAGKGQTGTDADYGGDGLGIWRDPT